MPDLQWNYKRWEQTEDWSSYGDRWSNGVGGPEGQWFWFLYPRIHRFLPATRLLEIAPGFGRWTQFLIRQSNELIGVDLAPRCVEACRKRFSEHRNAEFHVNDGYTLSMVQGRSIDFVFSFGSFVHMEEDVAGSYIKEIARVLHDRGAAFIHHSNGGAIYEGQPPHNFSRLSATFVAETARAHGLVPVTQEVHSWGTPIDEPISCMTVLAKPDSPHVRPFVFFVNDRQDAEAAYIDRLSQVYA